MMPQEFVKLYPSRSQAETGYEKLSDGRVSDVVTNLGERFSAKYRPDKEKYCVADNLDRLEITIFFEDKEIIEKMAKVANAAVLRGLVDGYKGLTPPSPRYKVTHGEIKKGWLSGKRADFDITDRASDQVEFSGRLDPTGYNALTAIINQAHDEGLSAGRVIQRTARHIQTIETNRDKGEGVILRRPPKLSDGPPKGAKFKIQSQTPAGTTGEMTLPATEEPDVTI